MKIELRKLSDIKPYPQNPRVNDGAVDAVGEQGVADLNAVNGYYVLVAMTVNVDRTPMPGGGKPPLPRLTK